MCPMRLGKQGPRAGKAGRQAEVHLNKGPHEGSASLLLHGTLEGELHLSLFHPLTGAHLHTRALIITGSWQGLGVGMGGVLGFKLPGKFRSQTACSQEPGAGSSNAECQKQVLRVKGPGNHMRR